MAGELKKIIELDPFVSSLLSADNFIFQKDSDEVTYKIALSLLVSEILRLADINGLTGGITLASGDKFLVELSGGNDKRKITYTEIVDQFTKALDINSLATGTANDTYQIIFDKVGVGNNEKITFSAFATYTNSKLQISAFSTDTPVATDVFLFEKGSNDVRKLTLQTLAEKAIEFWKMENETPTTTVGFGDAFLLERYDGGANPGGGDKFAIDSEALIEQLWLLYQFTNVPVETVLNANDLLLTEDSGGSNTKERITAQNLADNMMKFGLFDETKFLTGDQEYRKNPHHKDDNSLATSGTVAIDVETIGLASIIATGNITLNFTNFAVGMIVSVNLQTPATTTVTFQVGGVGATFDWVDNTAFASPTGGSIEKWKITIERNAIGYYASWVKMGA